jgi:hypothetical protein
VSRVADVSVEFFGRTNYLINRLTKPSLNASYLFYIEFRWIVDTTVLKCRRKEK